MQCDSCDVKNLIYQYADYLDRGDLRSVAALFDGGRLVAVMEGGAESEIVGEQAVHDMYRSFTRLYEDNGTPHTLHMTTNVIVELEEGGLSASSRSYAVVFQAVDDFPLQPIIGVRYYDSFSKASGSWAFSERKIESHLMGDLSQHLLQPM